MKEKTQGRMNRRMNTGVFLYETIMDLLFLQDEIIL